MPLIIFRLALRIFKYTACGLSPLYHNCCYNHDILSYYNLLLIAMIVKFAYFIDLPLMSLFGAFNLLDLLTAVIKFPVIVTTRIARIALRVLARNAILNFAAFQGRVFYYHIATQVLSRVFCLVDLLGLFEI
jgi:hypothetical protein